MFVSKDISEKQNYIFWKARLVKRLSIDHGIAPPSGECCETVEVRLNQKTSYLFLVVFTVQSVERKRKMLSAAEVFLGTSVRVSPWQEVGQQREEVPFLITSIGSCSPR